MHTTSSGKDTTQPRSTPWLPLTIDLILVLTFTVIGRLSHHENLAGTIITAIPFLCATLIAYCLPPVHRSSYSIYPAGVLVWITTALGGQLLRVLLGGTTHISFIVVTLVATGVLLLTWRLFTSLLRHLRK